MAIARFEPVTMLVAPERAEHAASLLGGDVEVVELPLDDSWFRDTGPIYVFENGQRVATDWAFNAWGGKFRPYDDDAAAAGRFARSRGDQTRVVDMVLEGGSITADGEGTIATTLQCLLHPNRNPTLSQRDITERLERELGATAVLWLPHGLALDDDTDGHVDNVAAFAAPGRLVVQGCDDRTEDDWLRLDVNRRVAAGAHDAGGRPIEVVEVPVLPFADFGGQRVVVPYLNFYVGNGFVVVPVCAHEADHDMLQLIGEQYPGREVIGLDVGAVLAYGGGGVHCITQQIPALASR